jgi:hypothetical protein
MPHWVNPFLIFSQGPGALWCDIDIVEFTYFGVHNADLREQLFSELVDGLRGMDPRIGAGTQVFWTCIYSYSMYFCTFLWTTSIYSYSQDFFNSHCKMWFECKCCCET